MEKLNKDHLVASYVAIKAEDGEKVSNAQAKDDVDAFLLAVMQTLGAYKDETPNNKNVRARLQLVGFGSVELRNVPARAHKNPQDPKAPPKVKPAHNKVVLTTGKVFEEFIN